jgi:hypothetical protein
MTDQLKINQEKIRNLQELCNKITDKINKIGNKHYSEVKNISNFYKNKFETKHSNSLELKAK